MSIRINIGCGQTPTKNWVNYDNSWSVRLAKKPIVLSVFKALGLLSTNQLKFIHFAKQNDIGWSNAADHIPHQDNTVEVIYSSHMIEHMEKEDVYNFLRESHRVLSKKGIIRISVPDIKLLVESYQKNGDADEFIDNTLLTNKSPRTFISKLKYLIVGQRHHLWMYDGESLCKLLVSAGFESAEIMVAGSTKIPEPGDLNLCERKHESVFVEAIKL